MGGLDGNGNQVKAAVQGSIRILQDANGCLYVDPDAQHYSEFTQPADILSIYSREIEALRRLTIHLVDLCARYAKILQGDNIKKVDRITLDEINRYLEAASWNMTLMLDPLSLTSLPNSKD